MGHPDHGIAGRAIGAFLPVLLSLLDSRSMVNYLQGTDKNARGSGVAGHWRGISVAAARYMRGI